MKNKYFLGITIFTILFISNIVLPVHASFSYVEWDIEGDFANDLRDNQFVQLTNGKNIIAIWNISEAWTSKINIRQYSSTGELDTEYNTGAYDIYDEDQDTTHKLRVYPLSSSEAVIFYLSSVDVASNTRLYGRALTWDSATASVSGDIDSVIITTDGDGGLHEPFKISSIEALDYDDDIYFVFYITAGNQVNKQYMVTCYYDIDGDTLNLVSATDLGSDDVNTEPAPLYAYQNPDNLDQIYVITSDPTTDVTQEIYYRIDLDDGSCETMATGTVGFWDNNYYNWFIGAGIEEYGGNYWLWFDWIRSFLDGTDRRYYVYQKVMNFSGAISLANLESTDIRSIEFNPSLAGSDTLLSWSIGYATNNTLMRIIFPEVSGSVLYTVYCDIETTDFYDFDSATFDDDGWIFEDSIPAPRDCDNVGWDPSYSTMLFLSDIDDDAKLYLNLSPQATSYDVILSWSPSDNPLETLTSYTFTVSATLNGIAWQGQTIEVLLNDVQIEFKIPNSQGKITFYRTFNTLGTYNITTKLWDSINGLVYTESEQVLVSVANEEDPYGESGVILPSYYAVFNSLIPVFAMIGIPAFYLGQVGGKYGFGRTAFIFGGIVGIGLAYMSGLIPPAVFYMIVLFIAVMFVMAFKSREQ